MKNIYKNCKVLVTGATGFKGSWLLEILKKLGAIVEGYSHELPSDPSHYYMLNKGDKKAFSFSDIRDKFFLENKIRNFKPDLIIHLAAQSLVLKSYEDPYETYTTNFLGTLNLLEACRTIYQPKGLIICTTDKVYENFGNVRYNERDELGGFDPYSNSKACVELLTQSYRDSFFNLNEFGKSHNILISTVRAGNILGGGDWSENRIIPDIIRSIVNKEKLIIRNSESIRPFQHVLDALTGYLLLGKNLLKGYKHFSGAYNFGPEEDNEITVLELLNKVKNNWNEFKYKIKKNSKHETTILRLDSFKSKSKLGWKPQYNINETIKKTIEWYKEYYNNNNVITHKQIDEYFDLI